MKAAATRSSWHQRGLACGLSLLCFWGEFRRVCQLTYEDKLTISLIGLQLLPTSPHGASTLNRRFLILVLVVGLCSTFFSVSNAAFSSPSVVRAAGCTTTSGSIAGLPFGLGSFLTGGSVNVATNPGDTVTATWPGTINITPFLGPGGGMTVFFGTILTSIDPLPYTITVCSAGAGQVTTTNFTDGRLNSHDPWETAALFCQPNGNLNVLVIGQPVWTLAFTVTPAAIAAVPKHPAQNTLIKQAHGAALYRLTDGLLQVNSPGLNP